MECCTYHEQRAIHILCTYTVFLYDVHMCNGMSGMNLGAIRRAPFTMPQVFVASTKRRPSRQNYFVSYMTRFSSIQPHIDTDVLNGRRRHRVSCVCCCFEL